MRLAMICSLVSLLLAAGAPAADETAQYKTYGAAPKMTEKPLTVSEVIKPENLDKQVRVEGAITAVCQEKGCWMKLTDGAGALRTTFKDYGFFVPKNSAGKKAICEGKVSQVTISEEQGRHYAETEGKSKEEIDKIVGEQKEFRLVAESVQIEP